MWSSHRRHPWHQRVIVSTLVAAVGLLAGCGTTYTTRLAPMPTALATATPNLTPIPLTPLNWQLGATLPDGINFLTGYDSFAIAPSDGTTAYACDISPQPQGVPNPGGESSRFWVTHDRGAHWALARSIAGQSNATACTIAIDAFNPGIVVLASSYAFRTAPPSPNQTVDEVTFNGGTTWQSLASNQLILQPATVGGVTYALRETQPDQSVNSPITTDLALSHDNLQTWTPIDAAILGASPQQKLLTYWLNADNGTILVETQDSASGNYRLWSSADTGQHWRELPASMVPGAFAVQMPTGAAPWHICGLSAGAQNEKTLGCSTDGGVTWVQLPLPKLAQVYASVNASMLTGTAIGIGSGGGLALATDGALLLTAATATDARGNATGETLYRLPAGATRWQALGPAPEPIVVYASGAGAGTLWATPIGQVAFDAQGRVFTATYP
jgi:hypothetical protein